MSARTYTEHGEKNILLKHNTNQKRNKCRSSTLIGLRHPEIALQATLRTGSIFEACDDLPQTGDAYSANSGVARGGARGPCPHKLFVNYLCV